MSVKRVTKHRVEKQLLESLRNCNGSSQGDHFLAHVHLQKAARGGVSGWRHLSAKIPMFPSATGRLDVTSVPQILNQS